MEQYKVVPDVISQVPSELLFVSYGDKIVTPGLELTPTEVKDQPQVSWIEEEAALYSLVMTDPDIPPQYPFKQFTHWLVVDIPGTDVQSGKHVFDYMGSGAPEGSGLHRYVFILFKQPGRLDATSISQLKDEKLTDRGVFSLQHFIKEHNLKEPIAANFFHAQYDDYVPILMASIAKKYE